MLAACLQAAVSMAQAEVQYGSNPRLIDLATMITAEQTAQIQQFNDFLAMMAASSS